MKQSIRMCANWTGPLTNNEILKLDHQTVQTGSQAAAGGLSGALVWGESNIVTPGKEDLTWPLAVTEGLVAIIPVH